MPGRRRRAAGPVLLRPRARWDPPPQHPEQADAYTVFEAMHWVLVLTGCSAERWPVQVRIGDGAPIGSALVRARTDYSAPQPGREIALPGATLIEALAALDPIAVEAEGPGMRLVAQFAVPAHQLIEEGIDITDSLPVMERDPIFREGTARSN